MNILSNCFVNRLAAILWTFAILSGQAIYAQISAGGTPVSFELGLSNANVPTANVANLNSDALRLQAEAADAQAASSLQAIAYQVAEPVAVNLNLTNSGAWTTLPDGSRLWRLRITSPGAEAIHLIYDEWRIPKYCELFVYNDARTQWFGAYLTPSNPAQTTGVTPPIRGDAITVEYHVGTEASEDGAITVSSVLHHFRAVQNQDRDALDDYGDSDPCNINVNCPAGGLWIPQRNAVVLMFMPGGGSCTGTLINNTRNDGNPYIYSAYHCYPTGTGSGFLFQFEFQSPGCANAVSTDTSYIGTAYVMSRWLDSDFLLVQMAMPPPMSFSPYYAGWDRTGNTPAGAICVHHPRADIKKISFENSPLYSTSWNGEFPDTHWGLQRWDMGLTQHGSSGSAYFNPAGLIVGQHHGGYDVTCGNDQTAAAGKFSAAWFGGGDSGNRLSDYLDPGVGNGGTLSGFQPVAPSNDLCANAIDVTSLPFTHSGNTRFALVDYNNCNGIGAPDVFYRLQFTCSTNVVLTTCDSRFDTQLHVFRGTACTNIFEDLGCNDDGPDCPIDETPGDSRFEFLAWPGEMYIVQLTGYGGTSGEYTFNVTGAAANLPQDICPGVEILNLPYQNIITNTNCATNQLLGYCANDGGSPDVVYKYIPNCTGYYDASTCGSFFDTILDVFHAPFPGPCNGVMEPAGCSDDYELCFFNTSFVRAYLYGGEVYYFVINGYNGATGYLRFQLSHVADPGDECPGFSIPALPYSTTGTTYCAYDNSPGGAPGGLGDESPDVVYTYTPTTCHTARVSLCGSSYDTALLVYRAHCDSANALQAYNDDFCGPQNYQSQLDFIARAGYTYYIYVDGYSMFSLGDYVLNVTNVGPFSEATDGCSGLNVLSLPYTVTGSTWCAAPGFAQCATGANDVIYAMNFPDCYDITASLCGSGFDTRMDILTWSGNGSSCPGDIVVDCIDDSYCGEIYTYQSVGSWRAEANTLYRIIVHGFNGAAGAYVLNVTGTPCVVAPDPVADMVVQFDPLSGNVVLEWENAGRTADVYHIYRSDDFDLLFDPGNLIADVTEGGYVCEGCIDGPRSFFGVIAENIPAVTSITPRQDITGLSKADAVMSEPVRFAAPIAYDINIERAAPNKAAQRDDTNRR